MHAEQRTLEREIEIEAHGANSRAFGVGSTTLGVGSTTLGAGSTTLGAGSTTLCSQGEQPRALRFDSCASHWGAVDGIDTRAPNSLSLGGLSLDGCSLPELLAVILGRECVGWTEFGSRAGGPDEALSNISDGGRVVGGCAPGDRGCDGSDLGEHDSGKLDSDESWRIRVNDGFLTAWSRAEPAHLMHALRITPDLALRLAACFALGRRVEQGRAPIRARLQSPVLVHQLMAPRLRGLPVETLHVLLLDGKHRLQRLVRVSEGTLTNAMVHPREVYAPAIAERAAAIIAVHNHPSGDPEPSEDDLRVTRRLVDTGVLLGVPMLDHVIVAEGGYVSLRERLRWEA